MYLLHILFYVHTLYATCKKYLYIRNHINVCLSRVKDKNLTQLTLTDCLLLMKKYLFLNQIYLQTKNIEKKKSLAKINCFYGKFNKFWLN